MTDDKQGSPEPQAAGMADGEPTKDQGMVSVAANVLLQHVSDETVLLDLGSGTYFGLDPIGTRMLDLARTERDVEVVVAALELEYEATGERLRHDLHHLLDELVEAGLVTRTGD
jgi:hypothetical protein